MSNLTIYQTVDRDSIFTKLDFRSKMIMVVSITIVAFVWESPFAGGALTFLLTVAALVAGVKWKYLRTIYLIMTSLGLMLLFFHGFFNKTGITSLLDVNVEELTYLFKLPSRWWLIGGMALSLEGLLYGLNAVFKSLSMVLVIPLAIFTTDVNNMIVSMVRAGISYKIAFIFSSTLRFFPLLFEQIQAIIEAQRLRGLAFEKMSAVMKIRVYSKVAVPLILSALMKSQMLEVVLQSKSFSDDPDRTYIHESKLNKADYVVIAFFIFFLITAVVAKITWGVGNFDWLFSW
jgi:energy-coupling factor transport system permease protein